MSHANLLRWGLLAVLVGGIGAGPADEPTSRDSQAEVRRLNDELDVTNARNQELQSELERVRKQVDELKRRLAAVPFEPRVPLNSQGVPQSWVPRQFNGVRYFLVPLDSNAPASEKRIEDIAHPKFSN